MKWFDCKVTSGKGFKLSNRSTEFGGKNIGKGESRKMLQNDINEIAKLQNKLFAENRQSLLIILQGMDSSGKDGTIRNIMRGVNPQGVMVTSFKHPSTQELEHDYLWRHTIKLPEHGQIAIFNRSHYENVLISKVHPEIVLAERLPYINSIHKIDKHFWQIRYNQINYFEKRNIETGTQILKFFLHLSKQEQCRRFLDRIEHKEKHWKFSSAAIEERKLWSAYQGAYEEAIQQTSTKIAPWYIIPADNKLKAHSLMGRIILKKLEEMNPSFPTIDKKEKKFMQLAQGKLEKESKRYFN